MSFADIVKFSSPDLSSFPSTRYQGSKRKLLVFLHEHLTDLPFETALDLFSGSGTVSLLLRTMNKHVDANDYLPFNQNTAQLFLTINSQDLPRRDEVEHDLRELLFGTLVVSPLVTTGFTGIYFTDTENDQIDRFCQNVGSVAPIRRSLYVYAIGQALLMKRPFSLFHRRNLNLRLNAVERTFGNKATWDRSILEHAVTAINELRHVTWGDHVGNAYCINTADRLNDLSDQYDLVYIDPPYIPAGNPAINYSDFYHFLTGLVDYSAFGRADRSKCHAPILDLASNWSKPVAVMMEVEHYMAKWPTAYIVFSYRGDGCPSPERLHELLSSNGRRCDLYWSDFQYALSSHKTQEALFISHPRSR
jgi:adenine-specific DNA-methyltransferase